jgi:hypothetical protein
MAVTFVGPRTVSWQGPVPLQAPPQLVNTEFASAVVVSVTVTGNFVVSMGMTQFVVPPPTGHVAPLSLVMIPLPAPGAQTVSAVALGWNAAYTFRARSVATVQVPVPLQTSPHQPAKYDPLAGFAVSVTVAGAGFVSASEHLPPLHVIPPLSAETVPWPPPSSTTVTECGWKTADTSCTAYMLSWQVPLPLQFPPQLAKTEVASGVAVSVTGDPSGGYAQHRPTVVLHWSPTSGVLKNVPLPGPYRSMSSVFVPCGAADSTFDRSLSYAEAPAFGLPSHAAETASSEAKQTRRRIRPSPGRSAPVGLVPFVKTDHRSPVCGTG